MRSASEITAICDSASMPTISWRLSLGYSNLDIFVKWKNQSKGRNFSNFLGLTLECMKGVKGFRVLFPAKSHGFHLGGHD